MKTKLHHYSFNISDPNQKEKYLALKEKLSKEKNRGKRHQVFDFDNYLRKTRDFDEVTIDTEFLFEDQLNTEEGLRIHNWYQAVWPNKDIKSGYYIDITPEIIAARKNQYKCGYTGKRFSKDNAPKFNLEALSNEFLEPELLHMLRVEPVSAGNRRAKLTEEERNYLMPLYVEAQTSSNNTLNLDKIIKETKQIAEKLTKQAERIKNCAKFLKQNNIQTNNMIYFNHSDLFRFGYRQSLCPEVKKALAEKLKDFPGKFELV